MIKPYHREFFSFIKQHTDAALMFHSCGSVYPLLPDLIEAGIDILNPVQVSAKDMEPERLKREFGDRLTFSGAIDTQCVLPYGTPPHVSRRAEAWRVSVAASLSPTQIMGGESSVLPQRGRKRTSGLTIQDSEDIRRWQARASDILRVSP